MKMKKLNRLKIMILIMKAAMIHWQVGSTSGETSILKIINTKRMLLFYQVILTMMMMI